MRFHLRVWRQAREEIKGNLVEYDVYDISPEMSFLEMMDELNRQFISADSDPVCDCTCRSIRFTQQSYCFDLEFPGVRFIWLSFFGHLEYSLSDIVAY